MNMSAAANPVDKKSEFFTQGLEAADPEVWGSVQDELNRQRDKIELIAPVIITSTREALASIPMSFREACWNLGASRWQTIRTIVLPNSISGILTGVILQVARAAGETAPILFTGVVFYTRVADTGIASYLPYGPTDKFMALSYHLFALATQVKDVSQSLQFGTAVVLIGLVAIPSYKPAYNDRYYMPADAPTNIGFAAADRHFSEARMNPDILMVNADHDMRNPADMLVLNAVARNVMHTEGIAMVQNITRPLGIPIQHSSIPFQTSVQGQTSNMNLPFQRAQLDTIKKTVDATNVSIDILERQYQLSLQQTALTQDSAAKSRDLLATTAELRDHIADFDDEFRPLRAYFYWEPHCYDIPMCFAIRSLFDSLDGIDRLTDQTAAVQGNTDQLADLAPKLTALLPQTIASMKVSRDLSLASYNSQKTLLDQSEATNDTALALGAAFDQAKNDDLFYLPPEAFQNPDFERGLKMFLAPDGKSARMFITHETDPATVEGIARVDSERKAAQDAIKMTSLSNAKIYLGGVAATYKDMSDGAEYDLMIAVVSALTLIFMIMLILTRAAVAALVIVGTAASSIAASFGISVLIWQDLFGIQVQWLVMLMSVIILLAVGSDYNLLLVSRFKDEIHAGLKTGIIRSMAGTGGVVTSAGLVFAATMAAMSFSKLIVLAQMGTTIAIGLLVDTLIVRSLLMPSIATLLGRWFWWPLVVYPRGDNHFRKPQPPPPPSEESDTAPVPVPA